jgi:hypothetical protein
MDMNKLGKALELRQEIERTEDVISTLELWGKGQSIEVCDINLCPTRYLRSFMDGMLLMYRAEVNKRTEYLKDEFEKL